MSCRADVLQAPCSRLLSSDELPVNCDRFITHGGLEFYYQTYLHCSNVLETIGEDGSTRITTIIRNMLGLMVRIMKGVIASDWLCEVTIDYYNWPLIGF